MPLVVLMQSIAGCGAASGACMQVAMLGDCENTSPRSYYVKMKMSEGGSGRYCRAFPPALHPRAGGH